MFRESDFLEMLRERAARQAPAAAIELSIGDDAALLRPRDPRVVVTIDLLLEGVDFVVAECGFAAAAAKAMKKSLSDLAAMGAIPLAAFTSVALPRGTTRTDAAALLDGLFDTARRFECPIAGGDTKRSGAGLVIDVAMLGEPAGAAAVTRSGARSGDLLFVTGRLGGAALGHHLEFEPRIAEGRALALHHGPTAMIDLSDGLASDLRHVCVASGVGAEVDAEAVPLSPSAIAASGRDGVPALEHALTDGEDYELLFAIRPDAEAALRSDPLLGSLVHRIGIVRPATAGVKLRRDGALHDLPARGFEHRFDRDGE